MSRRAVCLAALLLLAGCISEQNGSEQGEYVPQVGVSTRKDVVAEWGNPDAVFGDTWIWRSRRVIGGKLKASFMLIGATVKNISDSALERKLRFGEDGRLLSDETVEHFPGGDDWSINPWK